MPLRDQLRWGGLWIIVASALFSSMNIAAYAGHHTTAIQAVYGIGFTALILACTLIHVAQAQRAGLFGLAAYVTTVLSLVYANLITFLTLAELAGYPAAHAALTASWTSLPVGRVAVYGIFAGLPLLGMAAARAGVFPTWAGRLVALGVALQWPAQFATETVGPLFLIFAIGGSLLLGAGLAWIGWALWSGGAPVKTGATLSDLDRRWGGPFLIFAGGLFGLNAILNNVGELSLIDGVSHLLMYTSLIFASPIWYAAQAQRAGRIGLAGFLFTHLGATLSVIPSFLIVAQLAGALQTNDALMISWVEIPVGRAGNYLALAGLFLLGLSTARAAVFPRWSGWLVMAGLAVIVPTYFVTQPYLFQIFWAIGAALAGVGMARIGWRVSQSA